MWDFSHAYLSMHSLCQDDEDVKYPIVSQLQGQLHKGIWAHFHFLDAAFPKFSEGKHMTVHIISQCLCNSERLGHLRLNLQKDSREEINMSVIALRSFGFSESTAECCISDEIRNTAGNVSHTGIMV